MELADARSVWVKAYFIATGVGDKHADRFTIWWKMQMQKRLKRFMENFNPWLFRIGLVANILNIIFSIIFYKSLFAMLGWMVALCCFPYKEMKIGNIKTTIMAASNKETGHRT